MTHEERPWNFVGSEEAVDGNPKLAHSLINGCGKIKDLVGDESVDRAKGAAVHMQPRWVCRARDRGAINVPHEDKCVPNLVDLLYSIIHDHQDTMAQISIKTCIY
jgi:hypothetical protein